MLHLLINSRADPTVTCNQHETAASVAYASGHVIAADWLESLIMAKSGGGTMASDLLKSPR